MSLSRDDVIRLQELFERRLVLDSREFLTLAARPDHELHAVADIVATPDEWLPSPDANPLFVTVGKAAEETSRRIRNRFNVILGLFDTAPTVPARLVLQLMPRDTTSFFWARSSALLAAGSAGSAPSDQASASPEPPVPQGNPPRVAIAESNNHEQVQCAVLGAVKLLGCELNKEPPGHETLIRYARMQALATKWGAMTAAVIAVAGVVVAFVFGHLQWQVQRQVSVSQELQVALQLQAAPPPIAWTLFKVDPQGEEKLFTGAGTRGQADGKPATLGCLQLPDGCRLKAVVTNLTNATLRVRVLEIVAEPGGPFPMDKTLILTIPAGQPQSLTLQILPKALEVLLRDGIKRTLAMTFTAEPAP